MWHPIEANMTTPREDEVVLTSPTGRAWFMSAMRSSELIHRKGAKWAVVAAHPHESEGWTSFTLREILMVSTSQPKTEATPMKDQMQYIVIEGRKPQDGAKPTQALLILPKWISPTLACAGIVGRVIELTDGNVIEQGALPMGEQEVLAELREDARSDAESQMETDDRHEQELQAEGVTAPVASDLTDEAIDALAESMPGGVLGFMKDWGYRQFAREVQARCTAPDTAYKQGENTPLDDAYREGMQATRNKLAELLLPFGMPTDAKVPNWLKEELEELAQFRKDRPETLAKLQAAEDNLDAWRNAAGVADLIQVCDTQTGRITALLVQGEAKAELGTGGGRIAQLELIANNALRDMNNSNEEVCKLLTVNEHMREELRNMHAQLLERPTVMNFAGPVTIVQGNPPSVFGPDLGKSAE